MKSYGNKISLVKNSRGIYCLDTSIGCSSGMAANDDGCYNDCYAAKSAKLYGYDFTQTVLRRFENEQHRREVIRQISRAKLPFIRIGCSGDPSENWDHALSILEAIKHCNKEIVIITRHWTILSDRHLIAFSKLNVCINTSISALDSSEMLDISITQYNRIKPYCKSILRIVSCDFNINNPEGLERSIIQKSLFAHADTLDTVFRPSKNNPLVLNGVINTSTGRFNGHSAFMSKHNRKTYTGKCGSCKEMCGVNIGSKPNEGMPILKQLSLIPAKK